jgi:hypothetical protein
MKIFIALSAAISLAAFFYSARSLKRLLFLLFFFSLIEGVYINYFYPSQIPLLLKDALVGYTYLLFVVQGHLRGSVSKTGALLVPIAIYIGIYVLQVFNPGLSNPLVGLVGLRVAVFYIPLILVAQAAFREPREVVDFVKFALLLTAPVCLYSIYQYFSGAAHIASLGPGYVKRGVAILHGGGVGGVYTFRTLATFTYSSSFSIFIMLMAPFAWNLFRANEPQRWRYLALGTLLLLVIAQLTTGGRQALIFTVLTVLLAEGFRKRKVLTRLAAAGAIGLGILLGFFLLGEAKLARYETVLDLAQVKWRYETYFIGHNLTALRASPLGGGSGSASAAARHVKGLQVMATETAFSKIVYETGIPGVVAFLWMLGALLLRSRRIIRNLKDPSLLWFSRAFSAVAVITFLTSFNGWPLDVPPMNALFWALGGMLLASPALAAANSTDPLETRPTIASPQPVLAAH